MSAQIPDATPDSGRTDFRANAGFVRLKPREEHERYQLDEKMKRPGFDYFWAAVTRFGQPNPRFGEYLRAGWRPAEAKDFPDISGLQAQVDPRLIELGFMKEKKPSDPIEDRGLMLMMRPQPLSDQARREENVKADRQVDDQMAKLRAMSKKAIGDKTLISRQSERSRNFVPDDDEVEIQE